MLKTKTKIWISITATTFLGIGIILYYLVDYFVTYPFYPGLIIGLGVGVLIGLLTITLRPSKWWQEHSVWIKHVIQIIWEGIFLSFTMFFMFPHFVNNVLLGLDQFRISYIWQAFCKDIITYWYIYAFFFLSLLVWILFLLPHEREINERENLNGSLLIKLLKKTKYIINLLKRRPKLNE